MVDLLCLNGFTVLYFRAIHERYSTYIMTPAPGMRSRPLLSALIVLSGMTREKETLTQCQSPGDRNSGLTFFDGEKHKLPVRNLRHGAPSIISTAMNISSPGNAGFCIRPPAFGLRPNASLQAQGSISVRRTAVVIPAIINRHMGAARQPSPKAGRV